MVLLVTGASRQEIADELGVSYETVKAHLRSAYRRLGVHDRVDAINAFLDEAA
jgi:DNA-binding CsgD family transcriptional regulator